MRRLCFTVDLDRDVNDAVIGRSAAISMDRGQGTEPRFSSSEKGAQLIMDLMDDLGMRCTFFAEARTLRKTGVGKTISKHEVGLHGLDHEDFTGARTKVYLDQGQMREITERAMVIIRDDVGRSPRGFRSPYMDPNEEMLDFLHEYGIVYDSSRYEYVSRNTDVRKSEAYGLMEVPVPKAEDAQGKTITSYLWPMHEGKRGYRDFVDLGNRIYEGTYVICTHSWHMSETRGKGPLDPGEIKENYDRVRSVLSDLMDCGYMPQTCEEAVRDTLSRS
jgi:peptidoglycan/xylan/chitin deacetylase (PgdA/CDA1 family)